MGVLLRCRNERKRITLTKKSSILVKKVGKIVDWKGFIHHKFVPHGQKVNKEYFREVNRSLKEAARKKSSNF